MKTDATTKQQKEFDTVKFFRAVKEKIAKETEGMSFEEFKTFIGNRKLRKKSAVNP